MKILPFPKVLITRTLNHQDENSRVICKLSLVMFASHFLHALPISFLDSNSSFKLALISSFTDIFMTKNGSIAWPFSPHSTQITVLIISPWKLERLNIRFGEQSCFSVSVSSLIESSSIQRILQRIPCSSWLADDACFEHIKEGESLRPVLHVGPTSGKPKKIEFEMVLGFKT